jgi:hypothetical protein
MQAPVQAVYANTVMLLDGLPFKPHDQGPIASGAKWTMDKVLKAVGIMRRVGQHPLVTPMPLCDKVLRLPEQCCCRPLQARWANRLPN